MPKCRVAKFENNACVVLDLIKEKKESIHSCDLCQLVTFLPFHNSKFQKEP